MSGKLLFYYFGDDEAYYRTLQGEFQKNSKTSVDFHRFHGDSESKIQSLFLKVFTGKPACVFIDFSKRTQDYLHLARIISRTNFEHQLLLVGLLDYLSPPEVLRESTATGTHLNFIKSSESFDVAFSVSKLAAGNTGEHGFANATLKEEFEAGLLCKVGYVETTGIHVETDHAVSKGDRLVLKHHWLEKRVVPSRHLFVKNVSQSNMFYQFKYNADLEFLFIDDYLPADGVPPEEIKERQNEREDLILHHKKHLKKWMDENQTTSSEKRAKVLVVDYKFHFYQNQSRTDKHAYTIRCIPYFTDINQELDRLRPQIIAFEIQTEATEPKNTMESLRGLVKTLSTRPDGEKPYLIVFNSPVESQELQGSLQYPQTIAYKDELDPELLIKMADVLQKKLTNDTDPFKKDSYKVFIKKTHQSSVAEILRTVTVIKLSETDMILQSDYPFSPGTNLHFTSPVEMFVNIQPAQKSSGKTPEFYGLIHSLGETDKKELRRYVNSIFFRDHDAQVNAETDEFKKLNELKLQERLLQAQKAKEAAEAAASEKADLEPTTDPAKGSEVG